MSIWKLFASAKAKVKFERIHGADVVLPESMEVSYSSSERKSAFKKLNKALDKNFGKEGMQFHPDFIWPRRVWENNLFIVGSSGAGKTQVLKRVFDQILSLKTDSFLPKIGAPIQKKPGFIIYDIKGDFTEYYAGEPQVGIIGDWDERSLVIDIAKDLVDLPNISLFVSIFYPEPKNESGGSEFFRKMSIKILETVIVNIIEKRGTDWDWTHLYVALVALDENSHKLIELAPELKSALEQVDDEGEIKKNETIENIKMSLISVIDIVRTFAIPLLSKPSNYQKISLTDFLNGDTYQRTLILRDNMIYKKASDPYFSFIISYLVTKISKFEDTKEPRLFLGLDEGGKLPKMGALISNMMTFRSKGCVVIYGIQDISQIRKQYGRDAMLVFLGAFNTRLYGRVLEPKEAQLLTDALGESEFRQISQSTGKSTGGKGSKSENESVSNVTKKNLLASHLTEIVSGKGLGQPVRFWLRISSIPTILVDWKIEAFEKKYPSTVEAAWLKKNILTFDFDAYKAREALKVFNKAHIKEFEQNQYQKYCDWENEQVTENKVDIPEEKSINKEIGSKSDEQLENPKKSQPKPERKVRKARKVDI